MVISARYKVMCHYEFMANNRSIICIAKLRIPTHWWEGNQMFSLAILHLFSATNTYMRHQSLNDHEYYHSRDSDVVKRLTRNSSAPSTTGRRTSRL